MRDATGAPAAAGGLRILHVFDHSLPHQTGYAFRSAAILHEQQALGWQTWQVTSAKQESTGREESAGGYRFYRTSASRGPWARAPVLEQLDTVYTLARRLREILGSIRPQIIHTYSPCLTAFAALRLAREQGLPLVYEMRSSWEDAAVTRGTARPGGPRYRLSRALESLVLRRADAVTTICEGLRDDIVARGVDPGRVTVVPNAVEAAMLGPPSATRAAALRDEFGGRENRTLVGYIGSFHPYEGLELLVEAIVALGEERRRFRFLLAGGGSAEAGLRRRIDALGLGGDVRLLGRIPHDEIRDYYAAMDILVYPRARTPLTDKVTPLKPLEAMAQRRLVVASDIGGHRELVRHGETGLLFRPGDPAALAAALRDARDRPDRQALCARAHAYVTRERTWPECVRRYLPVYQRVLDAGGERG